MLDLRAALVFVWCGGSVKFAGSIGVWCGGSVKFAGNIGDCLVCR